MEYRQLGKTNLNVSAIGIGVEHLKKLSAEEINQILTQAFNQGINYVDLVWSLPNMVEGLQQALQKQNPKLHIAFHLCSTIKDGKYRLSRNPTECEQYLRILLTQLNMDSATVLNIHYIPNLTTWKEINKKGILTLAQKLKEQGIANVISISTHDPEVIKAAAQTGIVESVMHQVNIANHQNPARHEALQTCQCLGVGVVAMKPFAAGDLLRTGKKVNIPIYKTGWKQITLNIPAYSTPDRLLNYTLSQRGVCTAVTGVSSLTELTETLAYLKASPDEKAYGRLLENFTNQYIP